MSLCLEISFVRLLNFISVDGGLPAHRSCQRWRLFCRRLVHRERYHHRNHAFPVQIHHLLDIYPIWHPQLCQFTVRLGLVYVFPLSPLFPLLVVSLIPPTLRDTDPETSGRSLEEMDILFATDYLRVSKSEKVLARVREENPELYEAARKGDIAALHESLAVAKADGDTSKVGGRRSSPSASLVRVDETFKSSPN